ncbi:MAG: hypothetical protein ACI32C_04810 [Candidatus Enteromonas sp.]
MYILKSISNAFSRFWRWIRETAWVQPLLIVGGIFAIIFSIPKFSTWFSAMGSDSSKGYFNSYKLSLEGEDAVQDNEGNIRDSKADELTRTLYEYSYQFVAKDEFASYDAYRAALEEKHVISTYGEKYYLAYVDRDSSAVSTAAEAFETLQGVWGTGTYLPYHAGEEFRLHAIFTDDTSTNDDDYDLEEDKKAFSRYLQKWNGGNGGADFFSYVGTSLQDDTAYKMNAGIADSSYDNITTPDAGTWATPTIFLVDFSKSAWDSGRFGLIEALFTISGENNYEKAELLMNMWNYDNSSVSNPFSSYYNK